MQSVQPFKRQSNLSSRCQQQKALFIAPRAQAEEQLPQCFFHSENRIIKFCECSIAVHNSGECTLPLCEKCEEIHLEEHKKTKIKPIISSYAQVRDRAMKDLPQLIRRYRKGKENLIQVVYGQYQQAVQAVKLYFQCLIKQIDLATVSQNKLAEYELRNEKIHKGSIKSLIQHYSDIYPAGKSPKLCVGSSLAALNYSLKNLICFEEDGEARTLKYQLMPPKENQERSKLIEINQLSANQTKSATDVKRIEFSPKLTISKPLGNQRPGEENSGAYGNPFNIQRQAPDYIISPIDKLNNEARKKQPSPFKNQEGGQKELGIRITTGRKATIDLLDSNTINRKKYEDVRDTFRRGNMFLSGNNINRTNAASLQGRDWKKVINNIAGPTSQHSTSNMLTVPVAYQAGIDLLKKKDPQQSINDPQRSPSSSKNNNTKPKSNSPYAPDSHQIAVTKPLKHQNIKEILSRRSQLNQQMEKSRKKSAQINKDEEFKATQIIEKFGGVFSPQGLLICTLSDKKEGEFDMGDHQAAPPSKYVLDYSSLVNLKAPLGNQQFQQPIAPSIPVSTLIVASNGSHHSATTSHNSFLGIRSHDQYHVKPIESNNIVHSVRSGRFKEEQSKSASSRTPENFEYRYVPTKQATNGYQPQDKH